MNNTKKHFAFDTETHKGKAFLLCLTGDVVGFAKEIKTETDVIKFFKEVAQKKYGNIGWGYNLDYDIIALFKYFGKKFLSELYLLKKATYKNIEFDYIPKKFLSIRYKNETCILFELMQYYNTSLNNASEKFLGQKKKDVGGKESMKIIFSLYKKNKKKITDYCLQDADLTFQLALKLDEMLINVGLDVRKYYSCGYLSKRYLKQEGVTYPSLTDSSQQNFVKQAYFGGRIEFVKRGYFKHVYQYDICSAYPNACKDLENIVNTLYSNKIDKDAKYYFVEATVNIPPCFISPIAYREKMLVIYPTGTVKMVFDCFTWEKIKQFCVKIHTVLNVYTDGTKPFQKIVNTLYQKRISGSESEKYVLKIILNSMYGKFAQKNKDFVPVSNINGLFYIDNNIENVNRGIIKTEFGYFKKVEKYSLDSNIIYASLITALVRGQMYERSQELGNGFIGCMTDSIFTSKPLDKKYITTSKELGKFELVQRGMLYIIGSGVYQTEKGTKFRGYQTKNDLLGLARKNKTKHNFTLPSTEKKGLGKLVVQGIEFNTVNEIFDNVKNLNLNFDKKRVWENKFKSFGESLSKIQISKPIHL